MDIYASDEEKGEDIKQWWRDNGLSVLLGVSLGIAALFGGRYWMAQQDLNVVNASRLYQQANIYLAEGKDAEAATTVDTLFSDFSATPYATFAALDMAKSSLNNKDSNGAKSYLEWVINHAKLSGQKEIARLRLSHLQLNDADYDDALNTVNQGETKAFKSLFDELKGDIYIVQGKFNEAASAYRMARAALQENEPRGLILKLKLDDIAGS